MNTQENTREEKYEAGGAGEIFFRPEAGVIFVSFHAVWRLILRPEEAEVRGMLGEDIMKRTDGSISHQRLQKNGS